MLKTRDVGLGFKVGVGEGVSHPIGPRVFREGTGEGAAARPAPTLVSADQLAFARITCPETCAQASPGTRGVPRDPAKTRPQTRPKTSTDRVTRYPKIKKVGKTKTGFEIFISEIH